MSKGWIDLIFYVLFFSSVRVKKEERDVGEKGGGKRLCIDVRVERTEVCVRRRNAYHTYLCPR